MDIKNALINEIKHEGAKTRKMLERVPTDQLSWKPHDKSRALMNESKHIATLYRWIPRVLSTPEIDITKGSITPAPDFTTKEELLAMHDQSVSEALSQLENAKAEDLAQTWTFKSGEHVVFSMPRAAVIRDMALNHLVHHRGQLSVYLRLLNIPVPGMYGPSADE